MPVPGAGGRVEIGGYLDGLAIVDTGGGSRQLPQGLLDGQLDGVATDWLRGHAELRGQVGGPFEGGEAGVFNFVHTFQNRSPSLEINEAYAAVRLRHADIRIGVQKIAWGKLDGIPPTDVVNPRDYHDPLVEDFEEAKIGVPALLGSYYLPDLPGVALRQLRATLLYVPIAVPSRLPLPGERWFPSSLVRSSVVIRKADVEKALGPNVAISHDGDFVVPVDVGTSNRRAASGGGAGLQLSGTWREIDWDFYHYTGPYTGPDVDLLARLSGSYSPAPGSTQIQLELSHVDAVLRQAHDETHMTGFDWAAVLRDATLRGEAAFSQHRPFLRAASGLVTESVANLTPCQIGKIGNGLQMSGVADVPLGHLSPALDAVDWGFGVDYLWHGFFPLLQVNQTVILGSAPRLLIGNPDTRLTLLVRRSFWRERLQLELRGLYAFEQGSWFVFPRLSYLLRDDLRLRLGYLAIGGPEESLIGQFRTNDEVVFQARYSF